MVGAVGLRRIDIFLFRWGVISYADSLDCVGLLAFDVNTVQRVFGMKYQISHECILHLPDSVALHDAQDPTSVPIDTRKLISEHVDNKFQSKGSVLMGLRVGIPQVWFPRIL